MPDDKRVKFTEDLLAEIRRQRIVEIGEYPAAPADGTAGKRLAGADAPLILIVDDDEDATFAFRALLESEGFEVKTAANGTLALESIARRRPSVVMTDVRMPEMDGNELCRRLAADPATASLPVIVITGVSDADPATSAHARQVLQKPAEPDMVISALRDHNQ